MKKLIPIIVMILAISCGDPSSHDEHTEIEKMEYQDSLDAVAAAPKSHEVLLENDRVRVLRVTIAPGEKEPMHHHKWESVMYVEQPSRIRYYTADGDVGFESPMDQNFDDFNPAPDWMGSEGVHAVENIDTIPFIALRVELK